ncbi:MAG: phenol/toluene 2-monooxygenase [Thermoleophilaceae bacterium]|jgi:hypothetical protein|nr:phenol/toluene 2-monooxygenase [Thermoleophilaceae bacterium]
MSSSLARMELMAGEEADAVAEAAFEESPGTVITRVPGIVQIEAEGQLSFTCALVSEILGRPWTTRELQIIMAAYVGNIEQMDEEGVVLSWQEAVHPAPARNPTNGGDPA